MPRDGISPERHFRREMIVLAVSYVLGLIAAGILLYPHFSFFEGNADTENSAIIGFTTACILLAGGVTALVVPVQRLLAELRRRRTASFPSKRSTR